MPSMLLLFQGNISSSFIIHLDLSGLVAHPHLPTLGTRTCGCKELFHQLSPTNSIGQHTVSHTAGTMNQFVGFPPATTMVTPTVSTSTVMTGLAQQEHQYQGQQSSPHWSPSASSNSFSPASNPSDNTDEEQPDPLVSALSFSTAPGKLPAPLLSMHVSASIKKRIWAGQYVDLAYFCETQLVPNDDKAYKFSCSNSKH